MTGVPVTLTGMALDRDTAVAMFASLGHPTRLDVVRLLGLASPLGRTAGDLARLLAVPHNTLSTHLALLEQADLIRSRREGRSIRYALRSDRLAAAADLLAASAPGGPDLSRLATAPAPGARPVRVLIVCSGNSARSLMAEAILAREGRGRFAVGSAGRAPQPQPHPAAIDLLTRLGYDAAPLVPKALPRLHADGADATDLIITVCDRALEQAPPAWRHVPFLVHWGIPDPAEATGADVTQAFLDAYRALVARVMTLVTLPLETAPRREIDAALRAIARLDGATPLALARAIA